MSKTPEQFEKHDSLEAELVEALRTRPDAPETRELFVRWCEREEALADQDPTGRGRIELDRKRATLYYDARREEEAFEILWSAAEAAKNEGMEDLYLEIMEEYEKLNVPF